MTKTDSIPMTSNTIHKIWNCHFGVSHEDGCPHQQPIPNAIKQNTIHKILENFNKEFRDYSWYPDNWKPIEQFLLSSLEQIQKEERKFVGKQKREWYQRGIAEGQKEEREKVIEEVLRCKPDPYTEGQMQFYEMNKNTYNLKKDSPTWYNLSISQWEKGIRKLSQLEKEEK